jgi:glutamate-1-semialdehyde 2,1-aminomutase
VLSYADATGSNASAFNAFFHAMLERGIYLAPSAFEAGFLSSAHTDADIEARRRRTTMLARNRTGCRRPS